MLQSDLWKKVNRMIFELALIGKSVFCKIPDGQVRTCSIKKLRRIENWSLGMTCQFPSQWLTVICLKAPEANSLEVASFYTVNDILSGTKEGRMQQ